MNHHTVGKQRSARQLIGSISDADNKFMISQKGNNTPLNHVTRLEELTSHMMQPTCYMFQPMTEVCKPVNFIHCVQLRYRVGSFTFYNINYTERYTLSND
jgi:hypothetical protein